MFHRGLLTSLISISCTSCITYCVLKYLWTWNISPVPLSHFYGSCLPLPHVCWVEKNTQSSLGLHLVPAPPLWWDDEESHHGEFPDSSLLLSVWVLSAGEVPNYYLLDWILLHCPLEQQTAPLSAAYLQTCCKMSVLEACSPNTPILNPGFAMKIYSILKLKGQTSEI